MKNAPFLSISPRDLFKGFILATLTAIITSLYAIINTGTFPTDWATWKTVLLVGIGAGLSYLIKNFFTSSEDKFLKKEPIKKYN